MSDRKKPFKIRYAVISVLLVFLVVIAAVIGTHWDLVQAARIGLTKDPETIAAEQGAKDQEIEESLGISGMITEEMVAEAQAEIEQVLEETDGLIHTETAQRPASADQSDQPGDSGSTGGTASSGGSEQASATSTDIVARYTVKLYGVRGAFQGRVNGIAASAKAEYLALPAEKRTASAKYAILSSKLGEAEALEGQCDAAVEALLSQMQAELTAAGESTAPVSQLRSYYESAKASQKAAYLSQMR